MNDILIRARSDNVKLETMCLSPDIAGEVFKVR